MIIQCRISIFSAISLKKTIYRSIVGRKRHLALRLPGLILAYAYVVENLSFVPIFVHALFMHKHLWHLLLGIERWHKSLKHECIRPKVPISLTNARTFWLLIMCVSTTRADAHMPLDISRRRTGLQDVQRPFLPKENVR